MSTKVYFLGGTSPEGFQSKFIEQIKKPGYYTYILKGGPGTGKSTLMKKIAKAFEDHPVSVYYCSSDLNSLDAVVIEDKKIIVVDGTAPHVFEALYPAVSQEIINLGEFWDKKKMQEHTEAVKYCFDENQKYHNRVKCYVEAFSSLNTDIYRLAEDCLNKEKLQGYIGRLFRKLIPKSKSDRTGSIEFKQLSAFTTENYKTHPVTGEYSKYFINDDLFAGGDYFLKTLAGLFTEYGYDVTVSECTMLHSNTFEHMIVEKLGLAFVTGNFFNKLEYDNENVINFSRFYNKELLSAKKQRINFDRKASCELSQEAAASLKTALDIHDELEKYYIDAIDFERLDKMTEDFIQTLKNS
ncbi:AAA family ATPase [Porcipelethomonas sp.]|uniref:AAA family ATPase n=1 Tax=Porcipelethomonas sp. TaxID=2981675 RepID=UPI003EF918D9